MIGLPSSVKIYLATKPCDMRSGIDSLVGLVHRAGGDPFCGHLFVFVSRRKDRAKILTGSGARLQRSQQQPVFRYVPRCNE